MKSPTHRDDHFLKTSDVAELLNISDMTVKRWADKGILSCVRDGIGNYRRFLKQEVLALKEKMATHKADEAGENIEAKEFQSISEPIPPKPHPTHYLMHKYWGRKAHNVIAEYIKHFTKRGELVLDPFMGSGVSIVESVKAERQAIGVDLNPISTFIVNNTLSRVNLALFHTVYDDIYDELRQRYSDLYYTRCPICGEKSEFDIAVWEQDELKRLRGTCQKDGKFRKDADDADRMRVEQYKKRFAELEKQGKLWYPKEKIHQYVKRNQKEYIYELFTERALIILSELLLKINQVQDKKVRNLLLFCFSSMLPNVSKMLPGDLNNVMYKSGWVISKFWVPKIHTERNVFNCLNHRFKTIVKGKTELLDMNNDLAKLYNTSSDDLSFLDDESVDYVFTDPPYGESIAYFTLSHFWNSWLGTYVDYNNEIIIDPYRKKDLNDFDRRIKAVFKEVNRVLKTGKYMSFTFHSRNLEIWKVILESSLSSGFELVNIVMQPQAVSSGTQGINRNNTLRGDFIYNFKKIGTPHTRKFNYMKNAKTFILNKASQLIKEKNGVTSSQLYEYIIPIIVKEQAYLDDHGNVLNIEKLFETNFDYVKIGKEYKWVYKGMLDEKKSDLSVIDLFAGAGGFSSGFKDSGFNIIAAVEYDHDIAETYLANHPSTHLFVEDINKISSEEIQKLLDKHQRNCDVIIGGPPCQGFSMSGRRIRKNETFSEDPRNRLFIQFHRLVKDLKPKVFVIENVEGILNYHHGSVKQEIYDLFNAIGYDVHAELLNAADFGVPQLRKRAFFIGNNLGINSKYLFPAPTHSIENYVTVWDAISDLPNREAGEGKDVDTYPANRPNLNPFQQMMRDHSKYLYNHVAANHKKETIEKIKLIDQGKKQSDLDESLQTRSVHSGAYGRMEKHKPAYTITTRLNTPSVGRITHPEQHRTLTPREAARIQSFKDTYKFIGHITSLGIQIGNAVPPLLAASIAEKIKEVLTHPEVYKQDYPSEQNKQMSIFEYMH